MELIGADLLNILANPAVVVAVTAAIIGVFVDLSTKGLKYNIISRLIKCNKY